MEQGHRADGGPRGWPGTLRSCASDDVTSTAFAPSPADAGAAIMRGLLWRFQRSCEGRCIPGLTEADLAAHCHHRGSLAGGVPPDPAALRGRLRAGTIRDPQALGGAIGWSTRWMARRSSSRRNGQFTVNHRPDRWQPTGGRSSPRASHRGPPIGEAESAGSFKSTEAGDAVPIRCSAIPASGRLRVVGSSSHRSAETDRYLQDLRRRYSEMSFLAVGSSIKICMVAEGAADIYPRFGPTMEWDTARRTCDPEYGGRTTNPTRHG